MTSKNITLVFLPDGTAILEENDEQVWSSDDDEEFQEDIGDGPFDEEDAGKILEYLIEQEYVTEREAQLASVEIQEDTADDDDEEDIVDADFIEVKKPNPTPKTHKH